MGAIRIGLMLMQAPVAWLDLVAYTGYKYIALCVNLLVGMVAGPTAYYGALLYTGSSVGYFMLKTMAHAVPVSSSAGPKREFMLLGFAVLQLGACYWLGSTKDLGGLGEGVDS